MHGSSALRTITIRTNVNSTVTELQTSSQTFGRRDCTHGTRQDKFIRYAYTYLTNKKTYGTYTSRTSNALNNVNTVHNGKRRRNK